MLYCWMIYTVSSYFLTQPSSAFYGKYVKQCRLERASTERWQFLYPKQVSFIQNAFVLRIMGKTAKIDIVAKFILSFSSWPKEFPENFSLWKFKLKTSPNTSQALSATMCFKCEGLSTQKEGNGQFHLFSLLKFRQ